MAPGWYTGYIRCFIEYSFIRVKAWIVCCLAGEAVVTLMAIP